MQLKSVYLSRILGNKIHSGSNGMVGILMDLAVDINFKNPKVIVAIVKTRRGIRFIDFDKISVLKKNGQYILICNKVEDRELGDYMPLKKYVLDKQIIDVNGRKVVRANDVRLVMVSTGMFVVAVDIGLDGLLRRLGVAKSFKKIGVRVPSRLMLWQDIETAFTSRDILLSKAYKRLDTLHPSDLADIIEDFDVNTGAIIFSGLDNARAADVLEELEEDAQVSLLKTLPADKAADILEEMPADEAADVLDGLNENRAEELLSSMEKESSEEIRGLMKYKESLVGSLMDTEFLSYKDNYTVDEVISDIRNSAEEIEQVYYIYIVDSENKLIGVVSLMDLIISPSNNKMEGIMSRDVKYMEDTDEIIDLVKSMLKYNLFSMPIVDKQMHLLGIVSVNDAFYEFTKDNRKYR